MGWSMYARGSARHARCGRLPEDRTGLDESKERRFMDDSIQAVGTPQDRLTRLTHRRSPAVGQPAAGGPVLEWLGSLFCLGRRGPRAPSDMDLREEVPTRMASAGSISGQWRVPPISVPGSRFCLGSGLSDRSAELSSSARLLLIIDPSDREAEKLAPKGRETGLGSLDSEATASVTPRCLIDRCQRRGRLSASTKRGR